MKRKSQRCSTGHGTGVIQAKTIGPSKRVRLGLKRSGGQGMRDKKGRSIAASKRDFYRKPAPKTYLHGWWENVMLRLGEWKASRAA